MENYNVVIIGAGIAGLTCGCYLAKTGLKVLIVEQYSRVGGYCGSFKRKGYRFDVGVHYLGGVKNVFGDILKELELTDKIKFDRFDPTDKIIIGENITYIRQNNQETINEFRKSFPREKENIDDFFNFIMQKDFFNVYIKVKKISFQKLLDDFFKDLGLKATLELLLLNFGLSAKKASAITSVLLYRDYILDGGYYPVGGIQSFSDSFLTCYKQYGGEIILSKKVNEILVRNKKAVGVVLEKGEMIGADIVVSNADATQTFRELLKDYNCREKIFVNKLSVSNSIFALYIGTDKDLQNFTSETCNIWSFEKYDIDGYINNLKAEILISDLPFIMMTFPSAHSYDLKNKHKNTIQFFLIAPFESENFWTKYKDEMADKILKRAEKILPDLKEFIKVKVIATPMNFYKYTLNRDGAAFGWASTINQTNASLFPPTTSLDNLFLSGHWCTIGSGQGGVSKAVFTGRKVSHLVLQRLNNVFGHDKLFNNGNKK